MVKGIYEKMIFTNGKKVSLKNRFSKGRLFREVASAELREDRQVDQTGEGQLLPSARGHVIITNPMLRDQRVVSRNLPTLSRHSSGQNF